MTFTSYVFEKMIGRFEFGNMLIGTFWTNITAGLFG